MEVDKVDIARHHGVEDFPTLVFYKSEIPAVYEGTVQLGFAIPHENEFLHKMEKKSVFYIMKILLTLVLLVAGAS